MSGSIDIQYKTLQIVTAGDMSANINSNGPDLQGINEYYIQAVFTGSPVGTFKLQVSSDIVAVGSDTNPSANVVNWIDYTGSSQSISASGNFAWKVDAGGERYVRLVYIFSSGTGSLNVIYSGKN